MSFSVKSAENWINGYIPGAVIQEHKECGSCVAYLFKRQNFQGIYVSGTDVDRESYDLVVKNWTKDHGHISIVLEPEKFHTLVFQQKQDEEVPLSKRIVRPE